MMMPSPDNSPSEGSATPPAAGFDGIPGILDAATLAHLLQVEMARARRYEHPFTLLRLTVSDGVPDQDARRVAGALRLHTRWADSVGAEEDGSLLVILRDTPEAGARAAVAKIRQSLGHELEAPAGGQFRLASAAWRKGDDLARLMARLR